MYTFHITYKKVKLNADSTIGDDETQRYGSSMSQSQTLLPLRTSTLKKRHSIGTKASMRRMGSATTGVLTLADLQERSNVYNVSVPTRGSPTEILARRFEG